MTMFPIEMFSNSAYCFAGESFRFMGMHIPDLVARSARTRPARAVTSVDKIPNPVRRMR